MSEAVKVFIFQSMRVERLHAWKVFIERTGAAALTAFIIIFLVRFFILGVGRVDGRSMEPTFSDHQLFGVNKAAYWVGGPRRYDIVQILNPAESSLTLKRVVGLPGEQVIIKRGLVFVDGRELEEQYLDDLHSYTDPAMETVLGPAEYFVLGDNRTASTDSRVVGLIRRQHILGRVF